MKGIRNCFLAILFMAGWASCKSPAATVQENATGDTVLTGLERGPCFGQCPQYKVIIYTTGFAEYYGERNTPRLGYYQARLKAEELKAFSDLLVKYHMSDADSEYVNTRLADYPAYWLTVSDKKGSRRILVNHEEPPQRIVEFTAELDRLIGLIPWIQGRRDNDQ